MTRFKRDAVREIKQRIEKGAYDDADPKKLEAVVNGVLGDEPMTFEKWWASDEGVELRVVYESLRQAYTGNARETHLTLMVRLAWTRGEQLQMHLDHAAEMERLKSYSLTRPLPKVGCPE